MSSRILIALAMLGLLAGAAGCKPRAGSSCSRAAEGASLCADPSTMLVCQSQTYRAFACKGQKGCYEVLDKALCDLHGGQAGEPCAAGDKGRGVCPSPKQSLVCDGERLVAAECPGGCVEGVSRDGAETLKCDKGHPEGTCMKGLSQPTCSASGRELWGCQEGKWQIVGTCLGKNGCRLGPLGNMCDSIVSEVGASCDREMAGRRTCSLDRASILACEGASWRPAEACAQGSRCACDEYDVECSGEGCVIYSKNPSCR